MLDSLSGPAARVIGGRKGGLVLAEEEGTERLDRAEAENVWLLQEN